MSKKLLLDGRPLWQQRVVDIVDIACRLDHKPFDMGATADFHRNVLVLDAFDGRSERTTSELVARAMLSNPDWSELFHALRVGEALAWAIRHNVVKRDWGHT